MAIEKQFTNTLTDPSKGTVLDSTKYSSTDNLQEGSSTVNPEDYSVDIKYITDNITVNADHTVVGTGVFDKLMEVASKHLESQFNANRIRGEEYATAYLGVYTSTLEASIRILLEKNMQKQAILTQQTQRDLVVSQQQQLAAQRELVKSQILSESSKKAVYDRQCKGFDDDIKNKTAKMILDSWSVYLSTTTGAEPDIPAIFAVGTNVNTVVENVLKNANLDFVMKPIPPKTEK